MDEQHDANSTPIDADRQQQETAPKPKWRPLSSVDRRVAGVLAEKAKTTPDAYPLSLNAVCTGCNQKSNRSPIMQLEREDVEESLDRLREMGAVGIVQGYGRVSKYRHYLYDWLGVDKLEMAVMTELLLRGDQTEGELRARAARMEPIAGLPELRPVLESLKSKDLVVSLTPEGRGHVVTHALYQPQELQRLKGRYAQGDFASAASHQSGPVISAQARAETDFSAASQTPMPSRPTASAQSQAPGNEIVEKLLRDQDELRGQVAQLQSDFEEIAQRLRQTQDELQSLKDALGA